MDLQVATKDARAQVMLDAEKVLHATYKHEVIDEQAATKDVRAYATDDAEKIVQAADNDDGMHNKEPRRIRGRTLSTMWPKI